MALWHGEGAEEGIHTLQLIFDELYVSMDTLYQPPFLGEKAAKLAQKTPHCTLSQTEDSGFHVLLWRMGMQMVLMLELIA